MSDNFRKWKSMLDAAKTQDERDLVIQAMLQDDDVVVGIGDGLPIEIVETVSKLITDSVHIAIKEMILIAEHHRVDVVPVEYLRFMLTQPVTGAVTLMEALESSGIPVDYGCIPDDVSELEGL